MRAYSMDLRERVLADADAGMKTKPLAQKYQVSPAWVRRLKQRRRQTGDIGPRPRGGHRPHKVDRRQLWNLVHQKPDATLAELRACLGITCALSTLWTILRQLKITYKKSRSGPLSRIDRTSPKNERSGKHSKSAWTRKT